MSESKPKLELDDDEPVELFSPPCLLSELDPQWLEASKPRRKKKDDDEPAQ
ncbi:MAG: hypothetical protein RIM84_22485 [Alphaproteobacteria bacterium]